MNILVIGARAAGLKAACRARRLLPHAKITVVEEGHYVSYAACGLPYFLSADIDDFRRLNTTSYGLERTPEYFAAVKDVKVLTGIRAERIEPEHNKVLCRELSSGKSLTFAYDKLVLATGAAPIIPQIPGIELPGIYTFTRLQEARELRESISSNQTERVAIIGAGYIGCELCEAFTALWGVEVELFEREPQILPQLLDTEMARIVELELSRQNVNLHLNADIKSIKSADDKLQIRMSDGEIFKDFDRIVISAGVRPRTELARGTDLSVGPTGGFVVNARMQTNIANIFAAGDCVESVHAITGKPCHLPQGSIANRMGRVAGNVIAGREDAFNPVCGAACLKVFDLNVAAVGLTSRYARASGFDAGASWGFFGDKAVFYPEHDNISAKMVFDRDTQRILGIQAVGKGDVMRRIDTASIMIQQGWNLRQVRNFEPAYAPPFAEALDPLHFLSFAAIASLEESAPTFSPAELEQRAADCVVVDVREAFEVQQNPFPFACKSILHIPLTQLRSQIHKIPEDEKLIVVCARGTRSGEAVRILNENGLGNAQYLGGGLGFLQA